MHWTDRLRVAAVFALLLPLLLSTTVTALLLLAVRALTARTNGHPHSDN
jgi:hypothetical protein